MGFGWLSWSLSVQALRWLLRSRRLCRTPLHLAVERKLYRSLYMCLPLPLARCSWLRLLASWCPLVYRWWLFV